MTEPTTFDHISHWLVDQWYIAVVVVIAAVLIALPGVRDGLEVLFAPFRKKKKRLSAAELSEKQNRAYVQIEIEKIDFSLVKTTEVVLLVRNVGLTPAYSTVVYSWVDLRPFPHPAKGAFDGPCDPGPASKTIINAGQAIRNKTGSARPLSSKEAHMVRNGDQLRLYVYGRVEYVDAFEISRYTNFCFAVKGAAGELCDIAICPLHCDAN